MENKHWNEEMLMTLLRETLPESDLASVPEEALRGYARHGAFLREHSPFCRGVPEDIFLHFVFYPRVNTEDLVDCRGFFYEKLWPLVDGKSAGEAALAANRWCAAQMTYESTDGRTINPITAYFCGLGRCGEESTFAVTALRSVGIPARQVYAPWWSHCDDNHAWVEVYAEGAWHFLGACEPEPVLDRGWFTSAATRAMMVYSRSFLDFGLEGEQVVCRSGCCRMYNQTARYGETVAVTVTVADGEGEPVPGALVRFGVLNMADVMAIAEMETDGAGRARLECGRGSLLIEVQKGDCYAASHLRTDLEQECTLTLTHGAPKAGKWQLDFTAPAASGKNRTTLSPTQQRKKLAVLAQAKVAREGRIKSYYLPEYGELGDILRRAGGNAREIWVFYRGCRDEERPLARALLDSLAPKDYRDVTAPVLRSHLQACQGLEERADVIFPRIGLEQLTPWRQRILETLTEEEKGEFRAGPRKIWPWVQAHFPAGNHRYYPELWMTPVSALRLGAADERGQRVLAVAIARTLGIPARLGPVDGSVELWVDGVFQCAEKKPDLVTLTCRAEGAYFQNWTLARWDRGWQSLNLRENQVKLPRGLYRAITTNRLPNGNQLAEIQVFRLDDSGCLELSLRQGREAEMLAFHPVPLVPGGLELRLYLEVGAEPTEHALNELLAAENMDIPVRLLIPRAGDREDTTLRKVLDALPNAVLEVADFQDGTVEALARAMYLEPGVWPLTVLTDGSTGYYGHCGYGVNSVSLALRLAQYFARGVTDYAN